jgi:hypothetical protein
MTEVIFSLVFFGSRSTKLRVYFTLLLLTFFTLTASYKGSLTSNLSIEARPKPLNTARELADRYVSKATLLTLTTEHRGRWHQPRYKWNATICSVLTQPLATL